MPSQTSGIANGTVLRNRHTDQVTTVKDVEHNESGTWVTINYSQAEGTPRESGWLLSALLTHWEIVA